MLDFYSTTNHKFEWFLGIAISLVNLNGTNEVLRGQLKKFYIGYTIFYIHEKQRFQQLEQKILIWFWILGNFLFILEKKKKTHIRQWKRKKKVQINLQPLGETK